MAGRIVDEIEKLVEAGTSACLRGDFPAGEASLRAAIAGNPNRIDAVVNLGIALNTQKRAIEAIDLLEPYAKRKTPVAAIYLNLGNAKATRADTDGAISSYIDALACDASNAEAATNLGIVLQTAAGRIDAVATLERLSMAYPSNVELRREYGAALARVRRLQEAERVFREVLERVPTHTRAGYELGGTLCDLNRWADAEAVFSTCIRLEPERPELYQARGVTRSHLNRFAESIFDQEHALRLNPAYSQAWLSLGAAMMHAGRIDDACDAYRKCLVLDPRKNDVHGNLCFALSYLPSATQSDIFEEHRRWGAAHAPSSRPRPNFRNNGARINIGFVSPDLRTHSVAYFLLPLLQNIDREKVGIFCYADNVYQDATTDRIRQLCDGWHDIWGVADARAAKMIETDKVDILIDLAGHTSRNRLGLFSFRPAPFQMTWLGYPETTGVPDIDARISDGIVSPPGSEQYLVERNLVLPDGFHCYEAPPDAPPVVEPPAIDRGYVRFGSFNNLAKINPQVVRVWCDILRKVPKAQLTLKTRQLADSAIRDKYRSMFEAAGIDPARIELAEAQESTTEHLNRYSDIDIALDPFPYNGTTTTVEALWMGIPVVALQGDRFSARVSASLLSQMGLDRLVAGKVSEYVACAVNLARDVELLAKLRKTMRARVANSTLGNGAEFAKNWTDAVLNAYWDVRNMHETTIPPR